MSSSRANDILFDVLRLAVSDTVTTFPEDFDQYKNDVMALAKRQDVFMLVYDTVKSQNILLTPEIDTVFATQIYQYTQNEHLRKKTGELLSKAGIHYMPLKGAVLKQWYPKAWMRYCCDIDILVHEEDLDQSVKTLINAGFKTDGKREYHDISLYYSGAHLELHYNILENMLRIDHVLEQVWENAEAIGEYEYRETPAFFAYHILSHTLYHFLRGGCNIKQFVDLWFLRKNHYYEEADLLPLLKGSRLENFYTRICEILDAWFGGKEETDFTERVKTQVLLGGLIGGNMNHDTVDIMLNGGKGKYLLSAAFLPLREMRWIYPALRKYPLLLPFYYVKRIYSKTLGAEKGRTKAVLSTELKGEDSQMLEMVNLLTEMGLN